MHLEVVRILVLELLLDMLGHLCLPLAGYDGEIPRVYESLILQSLIICEAHFLLKQAFNDTLTNC